MSAPADNFRSDVLKWVLSEVRDHHLSNTEARAIIDSLQGRSQDVSISFSEPRVRDHIGLNPFDRQRDTHVVLGVTWCSIAMTSLLQMQGAPASLRSFTLDRPVLLDREAEATAHVEVDQDAGLLTVDVSNGHDNGPVASARLGDVRDEGRTTNLDSIRRGLREVEASSLYRRVESQRGPALAVARRVLRGEAMVVAELELGPELRPDANYLAVDPALLDAAYVASLEALPSDVKRESPEDAEGVWIPFSIDRLDVHDLVTSRCVCVARHVRSRGDVQTFDIDLCDEDGRILLAIEGFAYRYVRYARVASTVKEPASRSSDVEESSLRTIIRNYLVDQIMARNDHVAVQEHDTFMSNGMDSMDLIELARAIEDDLGVDLYPTLFFEHQTLDELAAWFEEHHADAFRPMPAGALEQTPIPVPEEKPQVAVVSDTSSTEIAIIGMESRFSASPDLGSFWENLVDRKNLVGEIPADRWSWQDWFHEDPESPGHTYSRWGSFIDASQFDAHHFGVSPREARWMDPQLRLLLELSQQAAEVAGLGGRIRGTKTGVFVGSCFTDYWDEIVRAHVPIRDYQGGSGLFSALAGRLSYTFDLRGPSIVVDTACASSLTALHLAVQALRAGECDMALVAGANLILSPLHHVIAAKTMALSPTGQCHSFDSRADGYVPGEGVVSLILKPLDAALRDGDPIQAVVKGSATNHNGGSNNPTAPRADAQVAVLEDAWRDADVEPNSIGYIEAHGTGTLLGDPVEFTALKRAFSQSTDVSSVCRLGSVKSNIGHLEGAAGLAGLIKVILLMQHGEYVGMPGFKTPNPYLGLEDSPFELDITPRAWAVSDGSPRRAGISSFGLSGTNTHVVVEEAPHSTNVSTDDEGPFVLVLSAPSEEQLRGWAEALALHLEREQPALADVAHTLCHGREHSSVRMAVVASHVDAAIRLLRATEPGSVGHSGAESGAVEIADDWLTGKVPDCVSGRLIALPPRPFRSDHHWFPIAIAGPEAGVETVIDSSSAETSAKLYLPEWHPVGPRQQPITGHRTVVIVGDEDSLVSARAHFRQAGDERVSTFILVDPGAALDLAPVESADALVAWHPGWTVGFGFQLLSALRRSAPRRVLIVHGHDPDAAPNASASALGAVALSPMSSGFPLTVIELAESVDTIDLIEAGMAEPTDSGGEIRISEGQRWTRTLSLLPATPTEKVVNRRPSISTGGVWLITGGLGALGRLVCRHLAERFGTGLVLTGRSALRRESDEFLADLREAGARHSEYHQVDAVDVEGLRAVLSDVRSRLGPINGVIHAAGVTDGRPWYDKELPDVEAILAPKVLGVRILDELTTGDDLDAFVVFSSAASVLGGMGLDDYAAANRYMDAHIVDREARRARGECHGRSISIGWPLWRDGGMHTPSEATYLSASGLNYLETEDGMSAFDAILASDWSHVVVLTGAPEALNRLTQGGGQHLGENAVPFASPRPSAGASSLPVHDDAHAHETARWVSETLVLMAAEVLTVEPGDVDPDENLGAFGFDSITLKDLAHRITDVLGASVAPTIFYTYPTLRAVAEFLMRDHPDDVNAAFIGSNSDSVAAAPDPVPVPVPLVPSRTERTSEPDQDDSVPLAVAVVGMAGRFPGAENPDAFWRRLVAGDDLVTEVPADRWSWQDIYSSERMTPGRTQSKWGGFLEGHDRFDADFFGISPREAELMDPQQRLFLETSWAAVEDAAWSPQDLQGRRVGVFSGVQFSEYQHLIDRAGIQRVQVGTGNAHTMIPNRVSYHLDLRGPSESIDTGCSSSLVAIHRAMRALRAGECEAALAGGVSLVLSPYYHVLSNQAGVLSPTGRCRTFDSAADGYVRGEGVGILVLKPLHTALRDGDHVYAVLRGGAVNHGGRANSPTAPNAAAQGEVIASALADAAVDPATISYIETHGTGTELGDPVEVEGLVRGFAAAFQRYGDDHVDDRGCALGSVKTQIGHLEPAAGVASLMKVILAMRHRTIPGLLHFESPNPYLALEGSRFHLGTRTGPWLPATDGDGRRHPLRAGVSSFGFGGANAHVVVEESPAEQPMRESCGRQLVVLSARTPERLREYAWHVSRALLTETTDRYGAGPDDVTLADVAYTLQTGRQAMSERLAIIATTLSEAADKLSVFARGAVPVDAVVSSATSAGALTDAAADVATDRSRDEMLWRADDLERLSCIWVSGADVDWSTLDRAVTPRHVPLPTYPFARTKHWIEETPPAAQTEEPGSGDAILPPLHEPHWIETSWTSESRLGPSDSAWIVTTEAGRDLVQEISARYSSVTVRDLDSAEMPRFSQDVWFLGVDEPDRILPSEDKADLALGFLRLVRGMDEEGLAETPMRLRVVTRNVHPWASAGAGAPYGATCLGLARSAAREHPVWETAIVDADDDSMMSRTVEQLFRGKMPMGEEVLVRGDRLLVRSLRPIRLDPGSSRPFRRYGVYMIVGGAGGIGSVLALHLAESFSCRIALLGRTPISDDHRELLDKIRARGGQGLYLSVDVSDEAAVRGAIREIEREYGALDGVIHSAMVLRDRTLRTMSDDDLHDVLTPKVAGIVALTDALRDRSLDFLLLMSSVQTFIGSPGQGNYAAASQFEDAFADSLRGRVAWPIKVVNWGYWGSVGAVASPYYARRLNQQGAQSIEPESGLAVVARLLASDTVDQVMAARVDADRLGDYVRLTDEVAPRGTTAHPASSDDDLAMILAGAPEPDPGAMEDADKGWRGLARLACRWLRSVAAKMGVRTEDSDHSPAVELRKLSGILPEHDQLLDALGDILEAERREHGIEEIPSTARLREEGRRLGTDYPGIRAHITLLESCMERYPELLRGEMAPSEVMFPGGRGSLREGAYGGETVTRHVNLLVAHAVRRFVRHRIATDQDSVRILEIGAGTGAATEEILRALGDDISNVAYGFTDVSAQFVNQAQNRLGSKYPRMTFDVLDIERDLATQGWRRNSCDLVVATNTLHATSDVAVSVGHVHELLRPDGWLVLNESTRVHDCTTLTFGLFQDWWRDRDRHRCLSNAPMLGRRAWLDVLSATGFGSSRVLGLGAAAPEALAEGQSVIVAVASGEVTQEVPGHEAIAPAPVRTRTLATSAPDAGARTESAVSDDALSLLVKETVIGVMADVLHVDDASLDLDESHADRGVDSVMAIEIVTIINAKLDIRIRSTDLFNYSTPRKIIDYICRDYGEALTSRLPVDSEESPSVGSTSAKIAESMSTVAGGELGIAVVGMSGQFPGARNLDELWENLCAGRCSVGESDRWGSDNPYDRRHPGISYSRSGGFLSDIDRFDSLFFNISPREAEVMDPQQRLFLQESWRAIEDAGHSPESLRGSSCGVYVGFNGSDYYRLVEAEVEDLDSHAFAGNSEAILAARLSYFLDLHGPCVTVNTACSSSLVAVDMACRALREGTVDSAVVGGVMVMTTPFFQHLASNAGMLSPSGKCRPFSDDADGFIPGEGIGVILLKRVEEALADGDHIYGVIVGSGTNQDGRTSGIMAPSGPSQTQLELSVYEKYGIDPSHFTYVEAHGTGTRLGDPIEVDALTDAFRVYTDEKAYCDIGSIKSNIGHTLATAGVAGLIKTLLCLDNGLLVPTVNVARENGLIDFKNSPFRVNQALRTWQTSRGVPRLAAMSSFGLSGTNAHLVVREAPAPAASSPHRRSAYPIPVSARSEEALRAELEALAQWVDSDADADLRDFSFTLAVGRTHFSDRVGWVVSDLSELRDLVHARLDGEEQTTVPAGVDPEVDAAVHAFLAGQNPDWQALFGQDSCRRLRIPTYPFQGESYWVPTAARTTSRAGEGSSAPPRRLHPLLHENNSTIGRCVFATHLTAEDPLVRDHIVADAPTLPGVAQLEMARAAGEIAAEVPIRRIKSVVWSHPIVVSSGEVTVETMITKDREGSFSFALTSGKGAVLHSRGRLITGQSGQSEFAHDRVDLDVLLAAATRPPIDGGVIYDSFERHGLRYGPALRAISALHHLDDGDGIVARVSEPADGSVAGYVLNPSLMDGALQASIGVLDQRELEGASRPYVPFDLDEIEVWSPTPVTGWALIRRSERFAGEGGHRFDVQILDDDGIVRVCFHELTFREKGTDSESATKAPVAGDPLEELLSQLTNGAITLAYAREQIEELA